MNRALETHPRLVIFDLDGVVYRGRQPIEGAAALTSLLRRSGVLVRFATNNSMAARATYVQRLSGMGIETDLEEIATSAAGGPAEVAVLPGLSLS